MRWVLTESSAIFHRWTLLSAEPLAELKYTLESKSVRIHFEHKRLFFLEPQKPFQQKLIIKSEYGMAIASIDLPKSAGMGSINIDGNLLYFDIYNSAIHLFGKDRPPLTQCQIEPFDDISSNELTALAFSYAWIYQQDKTKKTVSL